MGFGLRETGVVGEDVASGLGRERFSYALTARSITARFRGVRIQRLGRRITTCAVTSRVLAGYCASGQVVGGASYDSAGVRCW